MVPTAHLRAKLRDGLNTSTGATVGLSGYHQLAACALALCAPALLTVVLTLRLGTGARNPLFALWSCPAPDLAYLYVIVYVYVLLLGLAACEYPNGNISHPTQYLGTAGFRQSTRALFNRIIHACCGYRRCHHRSHISNMHPDRFKNLVSHRPFTIFVSGVSKHPIPIRTSTKHYYGPVH